MHPVRKWGAQISAWKKRKIDYSPEQSEEEDLLHVLPAERVEFHGAVEVVSGGEGGDGGEELPVEDEGVVAHAVGEGEAGE